MNALHGLSCERCRVGELCADDVVPTLIEVLLHDENPNVRNDADEFVRQAAAAARDGDYKRVKSRKALRRRQASAGTVA